MDGIKVEVGLFRDRNETLRRKKEKKEKGVEGKNDQSTLYA